MSRPTLFSPSLHRTSACNVVAESSPRSGDYPFNTNCQELMLLYSQFKDFILQRIYNLPYQEFIKRRRHGETWYILGDTGISEFITKYLTNNTRSSICNGKGQRLNCADLHRLCIWLLHGTDIMGYYKWAPMSELFYSSLMSLESDLSKLVQCGTQNSFRVWHTPRTGTMAIRCIYKPLLPTPEPTSSTYIPDLAKLESFK